MSKATLVALALIGSGAAEHGEAHFDWYTLGGMFTNMLVFFGLLAFLLRRPLSTFLTMRRENMAKALEEARAKQEEAERRLAEYEHKLKHLEEEIDAIVKSHEAQGEADRQRIREETDKAVDRLLRDVDFTIHQESLKAQQDIQRAAVEATVKIAEQMVKERITEADRRRLADENVNQIAKSDAA